MLELGKRISWLQKVKKKHPEFESWLTNKFPDSMLGKSEFLKNLHQEEFNRLKGRWASHLSREKNKNLSCSISRDAHQKLLTLKGNYSLKETLEVMITLTHQGQTPFNPILKQQKTNPLLETFPTIHSASLQANLESTTSLANIMTSIQEMEQRLRFQMEIISELQKRVSQVEINQK